VQDSELTQHFHIFFFSNRQESSFLKSSATTKKFSIGETMHETGLREMHQKSQLKKKK